MKFLLLIVVFCLPLASRAQDQHLMKITGPAFADGTTIPARFTSDGRDVNPPLQISNVPTAAKSLVLVVDDPDAPAGTWNHWLLWNIAPDTTSIEEGCPPPAATAGKNDFGSTAYRGPAPPSGTHRYYFRLFALDARLDMPVGSSRAQLEGAMKGHIIASAWLMGRYKRGR